MYRSYFSHMGKGSFVVVVVSHFLEYNKLKGFNCYSFLGTYSSNKLSVARHRTPNGQGSGLEIVLHVTLPLYILACPEGEYLLWHLCVQDVCSNYI